MLFDRFGEFQLLSKDLNLNVKKEKEQRLRIGTDSGVNVTLPPPVPSDLELGILQSAPLDDFISVQEGIKGGFERIERFLVEIENLHRNALLSVTGEDPDLKKKIEASSMLAAREAGNVRRLLKLMDEETKALNISGDLSPSDLRLRQWTQGAWCKKFMTLMEEFEGMQRVYRNKYKQQLERQYLLIKPDASEDELNELCEAPQTLTTWIFKKTHMTQALEGMKERQEEIQKLEKSMSELHEMFLDISFLVTQQGQTLNKVEEYVEGSREATEKAAGVMGGAVVRQRRAQRRRWIWAGLGMTVLVVLVVIIVLALTNSL